MKRRAFRNTPWALFMILVMSIAFVFLFSAKRKPELTLGRVKKGNLIQRVTIAGTVVPRKKTIMTPPYNGYIAKIFVQVGDFVHAGDSIVSISQSLKSAHEQVFPLRTPFDGTVVQVLKSEGEYVEQSAQNNKTIVRVDDLNKLQIEAYAPEIEVTRLKLGQRAVIKAAAILHRHYLGRLRRISLAAKEQQESEKSRVEFPVVLEVLDQDPELKPGMSVVIDIIAEQLNDVLLLGHEYVLKDEEEYFVHLADHSLKKIEVGSQNEDVFEIKSGLAEGTLVQPVDFLSQVRE